MSNQSAGAAPPPPGITPDLEHPRDGGRTTHMVGVVLINIIVTVFVAVRLYVAGRITCRIRVEDWLCICAWALLILFTAFVFLMIGHGEGLHIYDLTPPSLRSMTKWMYAVSTIFIPAAFFTKLTLLLLIRRVFNVQPSVSRFITFLILLMGAYYLPIQIMKMAVCIPIAAQWDPASYPGARCMDQRKLLAADCAMSIPVDVAILVLPAVLTWGLQTDWRKKLRIAGMLGAGGVAVSMSLYRMVLVIGFGDSTDPTRDVVMLDVTTVLELGIGIVCACLPAYRMLTKTGCRDSSTRGVRLGERANIPRTRDSTFTKKLRAVISSWSTGTMKPERRSRREEDGAVDSGLELDGTVARGGVV